MAKHWTKADRKRVQETLQYIAGNLDGGFAEIARRRRVHRASVSKWYTTGRVGSDHAEAIANMAAQCGLTVEPAQLSPTYKSKAVPA